MRTRILGSILFFAMTAGGAAMAADMPVKAVAPPAPSYNWTGLYVGGHVGWAWAREIRTSVFDLSGAFAPGFSFCCHRDGFIGGAQAGLNYQAGNWVFGVEGDWSWTQAKKVVVSTSVLVPGLVRTSDAEDQWYATLAGRLGYARDNWLFFVKGGAAWFHSERGAFDNQPSSVVDRFDTLTGWLVGAGMEWGLSGNWSAKAEYNYMDFGVTRLNFVVATPAVGAGTLAATQDFDTHAHAIKIGINYRFGGARPVVARY